MTEPTYLATNATVSFLASDGGLQLSNDKKSAQEFFLQHINQNTVFFHDLKEKLNYLLQNQYYEDEFIRMYDYEFIKYVFEKAYSYKFRFQGLLGAMMFYRQYALLTDDGQRYLERYEDRVAINALFLAQGDRQLALDAVAVMMGQAYQPATPTFTNAGRKRRGDLISCYLLRTEDNMESISRTINASLQLSKRGGGVAINLSNLREAGAPIKGIAGRARGPVPVMKILDDSFGYADQLGTRPGAGAAYISVHHPDVLAVLDTKKENADERVRVKTLSLGLVVTDVFWKKWSAGQPYYAFSPHDIERVYGKSFIDISITEMYDELVENAEIKKYKLDAEAVLQSGAAISGESGYPYILNEDVANKAHNLEGRINMSNLCTEILQRNSASEYDEALNYTKIGQDISCNLGSLNLVKALETGLEYSVHVGIKLLSQVSNMSTIPSVPSIGRGNTESRAVGLGAMNLHGLFIKFGIDYGSPDSVQLTDKLFEAIRFFAIDASMELARQHSPFHGFEKSKYATGEAFDQYINAEHEELRPKVAEVLSNFDLNLPTKEDWIELSKLVQENGLYNAYLLAVAPTGSISYVNNSTSSIHPTPMRVEGREQGTIGKVNYPTPYMTEDNFLSVETAYEVGPYKLIDVYAAASKHIDQGLSATIFYQDGVTTRDIINTWAYARKKGLKTVYYARFQRDDLDGTPDINSCTACEV